MTELKRNSQTRMIGIASVIWAASIFLSRVMGLVREQIVGRTLGASRQADVYFASFTLPDFLNYLLAAGALSIVFIPIFLSHLQRGDERRAWISFSVIANFILLVGTVGIAVLMALGRPLAELVAPGITDPTDIDALVRLTRIILPAQFFHVVGGLLSAALQAQNLHALSALAPLVYSAGIIIGGLIGAYYPQLGAEGFAWGVPVGSIAGPFALPLYGCIKSNMRWLPLISFSDPDLRRYLWLSLPIMIGFSIVIVDEWIVKNQASYLAPGTLAYLQYGRTLMKVPIGMFGMAVGVASYPTISELVTAGAIVKAYALLCRAVRLTLLLTFAAQVCLTIAGFEAVYLIWGLSAHRFSLSDAQETATVLTFLCIGLSGWAAQTLISRGFYALGSTWLPTLIGTVIAAAMTPVYVALRLRGGAMGLAVASSAAIIIYVMVLGWLQRRRFEREAIARGTTLEGSQGMLRVALRLAMSAVVATGLGLLARIQLLQWLPDANAMTVIGRATLLCMLGIGLYWGMAHLFRVGEIAEIQAVLLRKIRPAQAPDTPHQDS
ncbi:murein biosynthesis integral membrane protein MurJ [Bradyrhizobium elkanii]|uniref:murein biosynthesis integral membrane protein MurJ n=1 Tax=Bradyrhizobium elkanii TaxID=29448 RepID=UPI00209CBA57|nr:murein biosynthesis integral membrane protein MurJ [Bradyrhizobium elkanii]MCP1972661.1 putative peptidoglycan lipid II flippase [Bradyrhizobium elkanii]MCS4067512.1 putative peptidoglycan lipid II flippase [Bradyrhizobium elkanii]MCS4083048.1 putative peptidoglycan lipid II flippase [Bradyrhizobium elkanii]MCS4105831.1 putative peptidoglycan lipid II flippase [Bradyrhizobium elkanii]MCW2127327.1 putative peptidoglycan lipid II flippase [Bradyrhizobium elkanii]